MAKGYLLPEEISPVDNEYIIVAVPAHEGHRRAFWDAMQRLGYWWAWERDDLRRGKDAAARWREAIEETLELWERIGTLSPLTINVNCGSQNVCCNQQLYIVLNNDIHLSPEDYDEIIALPGGSIDDGVNPPRPDWENYDAYQQYKCNYALKFTNDLMNSLNSVATYMSAMQEWLESKIALFVTVDTISNMIEGVVATIFRENTYVERLIGYIMNIVEIDPVLWVTAKDVIDLIDPDEIRCAIYNANSAADAKVALANIMVQAQDDVGLGSSLTDLHFKYELNGWYGLFINLHNLEPAFDLTRIAETFGGAFCGDCTGAPVLPGVNTLADGLLHYWQLEEDTTASRVDEVGSFPLAPYGSVAIDANGITDNACAFAGSGSGAIWRSGRIAANPGNVVLSGPYTLALWFKPAATQQINGVLYSWASQSSWPSFNNCRAHFSTGATLIVRATIDGGAEYAVGLGTTYNANEWNLLIVEHDQVGQELRVTLNNGEPDVTAVSGSFEGRSTYFTLGGIQRGTNVPELIFNGSIDEVSVWDRPLLEDERDALWNLGFGLAWENINP
jgi:hypothetical protein